MITNQQLQHLALFINERYDINVDPLEVLETIVTHESINELMSHKGIHDSTISKTITYDICEKRIGMTPPTRKSSVNYTNEFHTAMACYHEWKKEH